jgi:hypothetical protein
MTNYIVADPNFSPSGNANVDMLKKAFIQMETLVNQLVPEGRRKAITLTKLEEACMLAVKAQFEG